MNTLQCSAEAYRDSSIALAIPVALMLAAYVFWRFYAAPRWQDSLVAYRNKVRSQVKSFFQ